LNLFFFKIISFDKNIFILLESHKTISSLSTCPNERLTQIINQKKSQPVVNLGAMQLIDEDMKIISCYLLENNTVMNKN
jgi:hypothetical protein